MNTPAPTDTPAPTPTHAAGPVTTGAINDFKVTLEGDTLVVSFAFTNKPSDYNAFHVFIDTDQSSKTGYKVSGTGADLMIENATIFTYNGDGSSSGLAASAGAPTWNTKLPKPPSPGRCRWPTWECKKAKRLISSARLVNTNWDAVATTMKLSVDLK